MNRLLPLKEGVSVWPFFLNWISKFSCLFCRAGRNQRCLAMMINIVIPASTLDTCLRWLVPVTWSVSSADMEGNSPLSFKERSLCYCSVHSQPFPKKNDKIFICKVLNWGWSLVTIFNLFRDYFIITCLLVCLFGFGWMFLLVLHFLDRDDRILSIVMFYHTLNCLTCINLCLKLSSLLDSSLLFKFAMELISDKLLWGVILRLDLYWLFVMLCVGTKSPRYHVLTWMILLKVSEVFSKPGGLCWEVGLGGIDGNSCRLLTLAILAVVSLHVFLWKWQQSQTGV